MSIGIIMLVHSDFDRAAQVARHWATAGCPVVIHVDKKVEADRFQAFRAELADVSQIWFSQRHTCDWGMWGIVAATQSAAELLLTQAPNADHVFLTSGSCLPLRPVSDLVGYLAARPTTDFIESATTSDVPWTVGGLSAERFTLRFPFSWKKHRHLFDGYVRMQRRLGLRRKIPGRLLPHMGSQWWCLTRKTLKAILQDPERAQYDRYFKRVWIPDESYFQTLARRHSTQIESRSLTLSKFDHQGKPHVFYDDHLRLLRRSDCFVARKIWPRADGLYQAFLSDEKPTGDPVEPSPGKIDRVFARALERRTRGRAGLYMQSRFPAQRGEASSTVAPYSVFQGFADLFEGFEPWLAQVSNAQVHGHLFAPERAEFCGGQQILSGAQSDDAGIRDYNPNSYLTNLLWNARGTRQCFQFGPRDTQKIADLMVHDVNAQISVVAGAWAVPLFRSDHDFALLRKEAARLQKVEAAFLAQLRSRWAKARIRIWSMAEFVESPIDPLQAILSEMGVADALSQHAPPKLVNLDGFGQFLQDLKNQGMHPYLMGDFPVGTPPRTAEGSPSLRKPYVVQ